jgi:hypothetical protein
MDEWQSGCSGYFDDAPPPAGSSSGNRFLTKKSVRRVHRLPRCHHESGRRDARPQRRWTDDTRVAMASRSFKSGRGTSTLVSKISNGKIAAVEAALDVPVLPATTAAAVKIRA